MGNNNSPLESLAAFTIVFVAGVLSTLSIGAYIRKIKRDAQKEIETAQSENARQIQ